MSLSKEDLTKLPTEATLPSIVFLMSLEKMSRMDPVVLYRVILENTETNLNSLKQKLAEEHDHFGLFRATQTLLQKSVKARVGAVDGQHRLFCGNCLSLGIAPKLSNPTEFHKITVFTDLADQGQMGDIGHGLYSLSL